MRVRPSNPQDKPRSWDAPSRIAPTEEGNTAGQYLYEDFDNLSLERRAESTLSESAQEVNPERRGGGYHYFDDDNLLSFFWLN